MSDDKEEEMALIAVGIFFGVVAALIARYKGRSEVRWFLVGFLLNVIGLIVVFLPPAVRAGVTKKCPKCAEIIRAEASVCRYCGSVLEPGKESEVY